MENYNGPVRQYFPKGNDFTKITAERVLEVEEEINQRPRNILAYRSPSDLLDKSRTTEHSPCGGFRGVEGLHFRTRSARLSVPSRDTAKEPSKLESR